VRIIALINQKGGVGKTTTAVNLAAALTGKGKRVLLVDIDPQANLSLHLNVDAEGDKGTVYDLLVGSRAFSEVVRELPTPNLTVVPSSIDLCSAELELVNTVGRELLLRDGLVDYIDSLDDPLDFVLIDCPPSLGLLSLNALAAAQEVFVPIQAEFFALQGMGKLMEVVELVRDRLKSGRTSSWPRLRATARTSSHTTPFPTVHRTTAPLPTRCSPGRRSGSLPMKLRRERRGIVRPLFLLPRIRTRIHWPTVFVRKTNPRKRPAAAAWRTPGEFPMREPDLQRHGEG